MRIWAQEMADAETLASALGRARAMLKYAVLMRRTGGEWGPEADGAVSVLLREIDEALGIIPEGEPLPPI